EGRQASAEPEPPSEAPAEAEAPREEGRVKASPLARRIARERGIELAGLTGTGPDGRIVAEDVERAAASPAPAAALAPAAVGAGAAAPAVAGEVEVQKLSSLRKTIARRLTAAWEIPAFQITMSADMTRALELRKLLGAQTAEGQPRPTVTDVLT